MRRHASPGSSSSSSFPSSVSSSPSVFVLLLLVVAVEAVAGQQCLNEVQTVLEVARSCGEGENDAWPQPPCNCSAHEGERREQCEYNSMVGQLHVLAAVRQFCLNDGSSGPGVLPDPTADVYPLPDTCGLLNGRGCVSAAPTSAVNDTVVAACGCVIAAYNRLMGLECNASLLLLLPEAHTTDYPDADTVCSSCNSSCRTVNSELIELRWNSSSLSEEALKIRIAAVVHVSPAQVVITHKMEEGDGLILIRLLFANLPSEAAAETAVQLLETAVNDEASNLRRTHALGHHFQKVDPSLPTDSPPPLPSPETKEEVPAYMIALLVIMGVGCIAALGGLAVMSMKAFGSGDDDDSEYQDGDGGDSELQQQDADGKPLPAQ